MNVPSLELGLPHPFNRKRVCPPPRTKGWGGTLPAAKGVGESQFQRLEKRLALCLLCAVTCSILMLLGHDKGPHNQGFGSAWICIVFGIWIRIRIRVKSWIRIRIKVKIQDLLIQVPIFSWSASNCNSFLDFRIGGSVGGYIKGCLMQNTYCLNWDFRTRLGKVSLKFNVFKA